MNETNQCPNINSLHQFKFAKKRNDFENNSKLRYESAVKIKQFTAIFDLTYLNSKSRSYKNKRIYTHYCCCF